MSDVIVWGVGELGAIFARGLLRVGCGVHPVLRDTDVAGLAARLPEPELVLIAVGEADLDATLRRVPAAWRDRLALLQNELRPRDWERHGLRAPSVCIVWFEKKRGADVRVVLPSVVSGAHAKRLAESLAALGIPCEQVEAAAALSALAAKNLYILVTNIAGLAVGGDVGALLGTHRAFALEVAHDVLDLEAALFAPHTFDREGALATLERAGAADPQHLCMGRSAPARLARSLAHADALGLAVPALRRIAAQADAR